jgi:hypothetical protein
MSEALYPTCPLCHYIAGEGEGIDSSRLSDQPLVWKCPDCNKFHKGWFQPYSDTEGINWIETDTSVGILTRIKWRFF